MRQTSDPASKRSRASTIQSARSGYLNFNGPSEEGVHALNLLRCSNSRVPLAASERDDLEGVTSEVSVLLTHRACMALGDVHCSRQSPKQKA